MKFAIAILVIGIVFFGWKMVSRSAYETARYEVVEKDGSIEIRSYPELKLVSTSMKFSAQGNDGSFMRLFGYISGKNDSQQKIAMTTPVFMDPEESDKQGKMSFVLPEKFSDRSVPEPSANGVEIDTRPAGRYAVIRFSGWLNDKTAAKAEEKLRSWLAERGLKAEAEMEAAGYDPPITPGPFRRNEVLLRLTEN